MPTPTHRVTLPTFLLALLVLGGCNKAKVEAVAPVDETIVTVRVAPIAQSTASPLVHAAAELARQTEADLSFPVPGLIERVSVRPGDRVSRGQELARLQPDTIEAHVTQATAALDKARRDLSRAEKLQSERAATLENLQDARTAVDTAGAQLRIADFNQRHAVITAPTGGTILHRLAEPNELVAAGRPVLSFASDGDGWIARAGLSMRDAARIALGAQVELADGTGRKTTGKVVRLAAAAEAVTRTVRVEILLDAPPPTARSGQIVSAQITPDPVPERPVVPLAALRDGSGGRAFVFVLKPGANVVQRVEVEVELVDGARAFLRSPLSTQQRVVVSGSQYLNDGSKVKIAD